MFPATIRLTCSRHSFRSCGPSSSLPLVLMMAWATSCTAVQSTEAFAQLNGTAAQTSEAPARPSTPDPATRPADVVRFPGVVIDRNARQIRVDCQALGVEAPLEFFCVSNGGPEHESVLRTPAKPSHIHAGLLMLGQEPGSPMTYSETTRKWIAPWGAPIRVSVEFTNPAGERMVLPATRLMRHVRTHEPVAAMSWIFAGSRQREDGAYLADLTGYVVSLVNFEHTLIDVPSLASAANDTLEWETNPDAGPLRGQAVTMILEPVGGPVTRPADVELSPDLNADPTSTGKGASIDELRRKWKAAVAPHEQAIQDAAQTHYQVIAELRRRQQALIDEADQLQRLIDELENEYAEMTTPKPQ